MWGHPILVFRNCIPEFPPMTASCADQFIQHLEFSSILGQHKSYTSIWFDFSKRIAVFCFSNRIAVFCSFSNRIAVLCFFNIYFNFLKNFSCLNGKSWRGLNCIIHQLGAALLQVCIKYTCIQICKYTYKYTCIQEYMYSRIHVYKYTCVQVCMYTR